MSKFRIERHGPDTSTIYVNGTPLIALSNDLLADLSAAVTQAMADQMQAITESEYSCPAISPVVFTEIADVKRCKCILGDGNPICDLPYLHLEPHANGTYCGNLVANISGIPECGHDRACHAEGKSNETV